jgi:hypothetical protein
LGKWLNSWSSGSDKSAAWHADVPH